MSEIDLPPKESLRYGWTTGACAAAAAKAAFAALVTGEFPDPVTITLPKGQTPAFALATTRLAAGRAEAGIVKDAGDDPDVTHGALIRAAVMPVPAGTGIVYRAGEGVGMVTRPGLPVPPGEPAINPMPRAMIAAGIREVAATAGVGRRCPRRDFGRWRGRTGKKDPESAPWHHRRHFDPGNHRGGGALFLFGLDSLDPSGH